MRRLLILTGLLVVLSLATSMDVTAFQSKTMCTTTCSRATLSCTPVSSCTSVSGTSIKCDGVVTTCSVADAWCACLDQCDANLDNCLANCEICSPCYTGNNTCIRHCGTQPPHTTC